MQIRNLREALSTKKISVHELAKSYLERIEKNSDLNAYTYIAEDILEQADRAQQKINNGELKLLTGIPISIKDNINVESMPTTNGSSLFTKNKVKTDAALVKNLKEHGAIILGKTNMDELAMGATGESSSYGASLNPLDKTRTAGGSSSGAAVSVAADLCVAAIGTDTGGSISQPASFCGLTGHKPSHFMFDTSGVFKMVPDMDQAGPMAKSAEDCMVMLACMSAFASGYPQEPFENLNGLKIGVIEQFLEGEALEPIKNIIKLLEEKGAKITYLDFEEALTAGELYAHYAYSICSKFMDEKLKDHQHLLGKEAIRRLELGRTFIKEGIFSEAVSKKSLLTKKASELLAENTFIIGPSATYKAPMFSEEIPHICTDWINLAGLPNLSTPMPVSGLPIGLSITSFPRMDGKILALANLIEQWN
ncbi:MAG: amidase [Defluviitaleaceae bacterium]|nr:amidase [Defluviitaleaceae bacterium]